MARRIEHQASFQLPAKQVYTAVADPAYLRGRLAALGGQNAKLLEHSASETATKYRLRQGVAASDLPSIARRFLNGDLVIERTETWQADGPGRYSGTVEAVIPGVPAQIAGKTRLADLDGGSELVVDGSVQVAIPLFGGKLEELIATQVTKLLTGEARFTLNWLAQEQEGMGPQPGTGNNTGNGTGNNRGAGNNRKAGNNGTENSTDNT